MFAFDTPRKPRRPSLTPMIDVVFLLLVFFMLAARFGADAGLTLSIGAGSGNEWQGPPRLVSVTVDGLLLNGVAQTPETLIAALDDLTDSRADPVVLRAEGGADVQALVDALALLSTAGFTGLLVAE
ncbi:ExbD/TolR family protein [Actibacterium sp. XHP0104]|uniref:ExbD/TolR family protein n=1 Tax=Actibacterium sp. XHP0104 TaxID=2984335 RepID=UPI0021E827B9|nr:biopolymer transporter ExbD [Actibacterium sp. XHP0104]MCV2881494.1 biopolymer transporter ExbD [Actibacterium sp. XHP0104]